MKQAQNSSLKGQKKALHKEDKEIKPWEWVKIYLGLSPGVQVSRQREQVGKGTEIGENCLKYFPL